MRRRKRKGNYRRGRHPLDERHYRAIKLLADGRMTHTEIAKEIGIGRVTLWRWLKRRDFRKAVDAAVERNLAPLRQRTKALAQAALLRAIERGDVETWDRLMPRYV